MSLQRSDFWRAAIAGEAIAWLSWPILKNLNLFDYLNLHYRELSYLFFVIWLILVPVILLVWLYSTYRLSVWRWPVMFEVGKYGVVGWLNVFLNTSLFNFFILISGIARGWLVDLFFIISVVITITSAFFWNKFWTFSSGQSGRAKLEYGKFFAVIAATSGLNVFLLHLIVNIIGAPAGWDSEIWANIALVIMLPVSIFGNFFGSKLLVFKKYENQAYKLKPPIPDLQKRN